ncbi:bifunctional adenosylcobinamide kinase/adenosylcobinamide-phosphate guanylyltransferase [Shimwellia blattae]|uniref:Bifunctional adenosylcobalamin biosynthesis protein n=2 Tax=Shimwellia blattae TaxID=563 RepID=I2B7U1_SHIBC|nr:bifunctional adenosylcobinamide kinase/adenosylcobinamide-phosphate guanylyltransferase [Shimwellia blattae]AAW83003.1 cobinamide kinase and guanylyltransferase [Shimwellia blattae]AFJ46595.1 bifunctional cobalamin biosynthesis protein CobU [Shimwellia blattae DSM 4481 = NBRC 105725]VDY64066.1 Adenosylcobinamide kinase [Shimwellia blattae]VEC22199.1 Adenosylcobinamide kinase [Shimwellia blattae]GAB80175.1 adenosylcobinamide kinase/adenosylcobinamide-phosphate guanylyltransferase [Shimwellia
MITLITGGARSGKSGHAEQLAAAAGEKVLYIATSQVCDEEMAERVAHHRASRPAHWRTVECWRDLASVITPENDPEEVILLECITTLISNLLFEVTGETPESEWDYAAIEQFIGQQIDTLLAACARCPSPVLLVTNEVGMGIVPENRLARHFRDMAGRVNQRLAAAAQDVWLVVSGIGVKIK